jgi:hypothetical protein
MNSETRNQVENIHKQVKECYLGLKRSHFSYLSPMVVSKLLICLKDLRNSLSLLHDLSMKEQEELAFLTLNGCKLIYDIGHPLIYYSCGKYVYETLTFAVLSMENIINLCTIRHIKFRMKLFSSIFYGSLSAGFLDESTGILEHATKEIKNLREREELDPPVPQITLDILSECDEDLAIMSFVLSVWKDSSEVIAFNKAKAPSSPRSGSSTSTSSAPSASFFMSKCIEEVVRIHLLCSGNINETYLKRSSALCKGLFALLNDSSASKPEDLLSKLKPETLYEITYLLIFEGESQVAKDSHDKLLSLVTALEEKEKESVEREEERVSEIAKIRSRMWLLLSIEELIDCELTASNITKLNEIIEELNMIIYDETAYRNKSFFSKVAQTLFIKVLYRPIQKCLSSKTSSDISFLKEVMDSMIILVKVFDLSIHQDPIFYFGISILTTNIIYEIAEYRKGISLIKEILFSMENERASRVDFLLQLPQDIRDVYALQRQSFCIKSEMFDWFHSEKRLGANAFAGYGIFGLSSAADRSDQALAELHVDLLSLYFRLELKYALNHYHERRIHKAVNDEIQSRKLAETPSVKAAKEKKEKLTGKKAKKVNNQTKEILSTIHIQKGNNEEITNGNGGNGNDFSLEKLHVIPYLKVYCCKNNYSLSILYIEMAKIEMNEEQQLKYLENAYQCIEEVEKSEQALIHNFSDFTFLTDQVTKKYPIVLSRSHRYIYVIPVASRKLCNKVSYFRILAKEKGSGTDVSIYNTLLPGSDYKIPTSSYLENDGSSLNNIVVKIGPLRSGEAYMFGSAGYLIPGININAVSQTAPEDQVVGGVSLTSPVVEAVNPLPTIILWSILGETSRQLGNGKYNVLAVKASQQVCQRFFLSFPEQKMITLSTGFNLFLYDEPALCSLIIKQSTTNLIHYFIESFLRYETLLFQSELFGKEINWSTDRKRIQLRYISSLSKTSLIVSLATSIGNQELTIKVLTLAEQLISELLKYDFTAVAPYIEKYVLICITSLQRISKRHWSMLEHKLYQIFIFQYLQLCLNNNNVKPAIKMLSEYYPEIREKEVELLSKPSNDVLSYIIACRFFIDTSFPNNVKDVVLKDMNKLILESGSTEGIKPLGGEISPRAADDEIGSFWKLPSINRLFKILNLSIDLMTETKTSTEKTALEKYLQVDSPLVYSDYLEVLVSLMKELAMSQRYDLLAKVLMKYPICLDFLASSVKENLMKWKMNYFLIPLSPFSQYKTAVVAALSQPGGGAAGGKKPSVVAAPPAKGGKGGATTTTTTVIEAVDPSTLLTEATVPERFLTISEEEIKRQYDFLNEIWILLINNSNALKKNNNKYDFNMNFFSETSKSPNHLIIAENKEKYMKEMQQVKDKNDSPSNEMKGATTDMEVKTSPRAGGSPRAAGKGGDTTSVTVGEPSILQPYFPSSDPSASYSMSLIIQLLSLSVDCAKKAKKVNSSVNICVKLWNLIISEYYDPITFATTFTSSKEIIHLAFLAIVELFQMIYSATGNGTLHGAAGNTVSFAGEDVYSDYEERDKKYKVSLLTDLFFFFIKIEYLHKEFFLELVKNSLSVFYLYCQSPLLHEYCLKIEKEVLSLIIQSQEQLITDANSAVSQAETDLNTFITVYEENEKKKRKKKLRIERTEKTEEELLFEKEKQLFESIIEEKKGILRNREEGMSQISSFQEILYSLLSKEQIFLTSLQKETFLFLQEVEEHFGKNLDFSLLFSSSVSVTGLEVLSPSAPEVSPSQLKAKFLSSFSSLKAKYNKLAKTLRNQKEKVLLVIVLNDYSNLLIKCQQWTLLKQCGYDAVDGLFNALDTCQSWPTIGDKMISSFSHSELLRGIPYVLIALGKLSKYCAYSSSATAASGLTAAPQQVNIKEKLLYSRIASDISMLLFQTSINHPSHLIGFTGYECYELQGINAFSSSEFLFPFFSMNEELIFNSLLFVSDNSLIHNGYEVNYHSELIKVLPLIVLNEYLAMNCFHNSNLWLQSRISRVKVLISCHAFAEAVSMLASIPYHIQNIQNHAIHGKSQYSLSYSSPFHKEGTTEITSFLEVASNGLKFYGNPVFLNSSLPFSEEIGGGSSNLKALQWLLEYPKVIESFLSNYTMKVPEAFWNEDERKKIDVQRRIIEEMNGKVNAPPSDVKDAKNAKKKDSVDASASGEAMKALQAMIPSIGLFSSYQIMDLYLLVGTFFLEMIYMNESNYSLSFNSTLSTASATAAAGGKGGVAAVAGGEGTNHCLSFLSESKKMISKARELLFALNKPPAEGNAVSSIAYSSQQVRDIHDYYKMHFLVEKEKKKEAVITNDEEGREEQGQEETRSSVSSSSVNASHELFNKLSNEEKELILSIQNDKDFFYFYNRIILLENSILFYSRNYREIYGNTYQIMKFLKNPILFLPSSSFVSTLDTAAPSYSFSHPHYPMILSNFWFQIREFQINVNYQQARYSDMIPLISQSLVESSLLSYSSFQLKCYYFRGKAYYKLGNLGSALKDCQMIIDFLQSQESKQFDFLYFKTLILKCMIVREKIRFLIPCGILPGREFFVEQNSSQNVYLLMIEMVLTLRHAKGLLEGNMNFIGILNPDSNVTYHDLLSNTGKCLLLCFFLPFLSFLSLFRSCGWKRQSCDET